MSDVDEPQQPAVRIAPVGDRIGETESQPKLRVSAPPRARRLPVVTIALLVFITLTTAIEFVIAHSIKPSPAVLVALGGMSSSAVRAGDWYRLVTAALLHGGVLHLVFNAIALALGGAIVESLVHRGWLVVIAVVSAVFGSLLGCFLNDASIVSVGASGAIMGILSSGMVLAFRLPRGPGRNRVLSTLGWFLVPSLLPLATISSSDHIDYAAHIGGTVGGVLVGALILGARSFNSARVASITATLGIAVVAGSVGADAKHYRDHRAADDALDGSALLVADERIPKDPRLAARTVEVWGKGHPRDPRVHLYRAENILDRAMQPRPFEQPIDAVLAMDDATEKAEAELRAALAEKTILNQFFPDRRMEVGIRVMLCGLLVDRGRTEEAENEARPVCHAGESGSVPDDLKELGLCAKNP